MDALDHTLRQNVSRQGNPYGPVRNRSWTGKLWFALIVLLPTLISACYMFGFAADQYISEARFVVRGPASQTASVLSGILQSTGMSHAQEDTYVVQDYMQSRDAMAELIQSVDLKAIFDRPEADPLFRFPLWKGWASDEHLFKYYKDHVTTELDSTTGVSSLLVRTFRADDSQHIASALLLAGEALVNRMNARQRENSVRQARQDVEAAEVRVSDVGRHIAEFRNRESLLDPTKQSVPLLTGISDLQTSLIKTNLEIAQLTAASPITAMPSSGSITSPLPLSRKVCFASVTISKASSCRSILSVRQSFASSTAARPRLPAYCSSLVSKAGKEREGVRSRSRKARQDFVLVELAYLLRGVLHHSRANGHLPVGRHHDSIRRAGRRSPWLSGRGGLPLRSIGWPEPPRCGS